MVISYYNTIRRNPKGKEYMEKANIDRINELARLARERDLTPEEAAERHQRRQKYLEAFRKNFRNQLEHTVIQREDGTREPLKKKN